MKKPPIRVTKWPGDIPVAAKSTLKTLVTDLPSKIRSEVAFLGQGQTYRGFWKGIEAESIFFYSGNARSRMAWTDDR